jgi:hypothetical protein
MLAVARGRVHAVQAAQTVGEIGASKLADLMLGYAHPLALNLSGYTVENVRAESSTQTESPTGLTSVINQLHSRQVCEFMAAVIEVKALAVPTANFRQGDLLDLLWQAWMKATRAPRKGVQQP